MMKEQEKNPQDMYHQGKYPKQEQPAPGIEGEMNPVPESGEKTYQGTGRLAGRKALITGGDSGIGRATAIAYAREGAKVAVNYLPSEQEDADSLKQILAEEGIEIIQIPADLSTEKEAVEVIEQSVKELGGLDILVLNAAVQVAVEKIEDLSTEQIRHTFDVNVFAVMFMAKAAVGHMREGSSMIITSSSQYFSPSPDLLDYAASKSAVAGFGVALAKQVIDRGIRVNVVCPGPVWTPLEVAGGQLPDDLPEFGQSTALKRSAQPAEMAGMYVFLASRDATFVVGEIYGLTGGTSR